MRVAKTVAVDGVAVPRFVYGTAWKEADTAAAVTRALDLGFRGVDTANQRKHYDEASVGAALRAAFSGGMPRADCFVQTKFTHRGGQDHRLPYDPRAPLAQQVRESFESSLQHLGVTQLDAYVLHGPSTRLGFSAPDLEVWRAMEALHEEERTRLLGISNVSREQLEALASVATSLPKVVQNRCYARTGWDAEVRNWCRENGAVYQGFSLLTANERELRLAPVTKAAARLGKTPEEIVFRFALEVGMVCLTGSMSPSHLRGDLACFEFELTTQEVAEIERVSSAG